MGLNFLERAMILELRQMISAFLFNNNKILMIKKRGGRLFDFEHWSSLGGHIEQDEMNSPSVACLREVYEESGINEDDISDFELKYIMFRKKGHEIRQHFVYFGVVGKVELVSSDEGELFWIDKDDMLDLHIPETIKFLMKHYFENDGKDGLNVGVVTMGDDDKPRIQWSTMMDPLVF